MNLLKTLIIAIAALFFMSGCQTTGVSVKGPGASSSPPTRKKAPRPMHLPMATGTNTTTAMIWNLTRNWAPMWFSISQKHGLATTFTSGCQPMDDGWSPPPLKADGGWL